ARASHAHQCRRKCAEMQPGGTFLQKIVQKRVVFVIQAIASIWHLTAVWVAELFAKAQSYKSSPRKTAGRHADTVPTHPARARQHRVLDVEQTQTVQNGNKTDFATAHSIRRHTRCR
ncbi:hypothetical protein COOONC_10453, partial [Cooperia oncophora]